MLRDHYYLAVEKDQHRHSHLVRFLAASISISLGILAYRFKTPWRHSQQLLLTFSHTKEDVVASPLPSIRSDCDSQLIRCDLGCRNYLRPWKSRQCRDTCDQHMIACCAVAGCDLVTTPSGRMAGASARVLRQVPAFNGSAAALLFDLDGTLIDDIPFQNALRACLPWKKPFGGGIVPWPRLGQMLFECSRHRSDFLVRLAREQGVRAIQSVVDFAVRAKQKGIPIALVTRAPTCWVQGMLNVTGLEQLFAETVWITVTRAPTCWVQGMLNVTGLEQLFAETVWITKNTRGIKHKKPHPDPWLLAAKKLGVPPQDCTCYDDSDSVLNGLRKAGMTAVDVKTLPGYPLHEEA
eukprot:gnl/TRDRNA2_/TRDRNA2_168701_c1_seq1.p1 gnl/TRDRNA2_/TRDRNA2_168701_c1~~gnl/TRDRNA2_/TRDRNA2_168701_c1_seq1.p1  ORF type:complete len:351 (+),score=39.84 gnl/TRDRNA2_/TRDRNA2_168701_c1_seq1:207-1259(+)